MKLYRKLTAICLTAALAVGMAVTASADVSPVTVTVNGETTSTSAYINSDWRTMVPAETAKALGVDYSVQGNSVTFTAGSLSQTYTVGEAAGDTVPAMVNGTIYVPFYHLAEAFGYDVSWNSATGSASAAGVGPGKELSGKGIAIDTGNRDLYSKEENALEQKYGWYTWSFDIDPAMDTVGTVGDGQGLLRFRLFVPENTVQGKAYPLVATLGGLGGTNSFANNGYAKMGEAFASSQFQGEAPCYVLNITVPFEACVNYEAELAYVYEFGEIIKAIASCYGNVDMNRIYATGMSQGAGWSYELASVQPDLLAAILINAGTTIHTTWGDQCDMEAIAKSGVNTYIWHGYEDPYIPVNEAFRAFHTLTSLGQTNLVLDIQKGGHCLGSMLSAEETTSYMSWLFAQVKGVPCTESPIVSAEDTFADYDWAGVQVLSSIEGWATAHAYSEWTEPAENTVWAQVRASAQRIAQGSGGTGKTWLSKVRIGDETATSYDDATKDAPQVTIKAGDTVAVTVQGYTGGYGDDWTAFNKEWDVEWAVLEGSVTNIELTDAASETPILRPESVSLANGGGPNVNNSLYNENTLDGRQVYIKIDTAEEFHGETLKVALRFIRTLGDGEYASYWHIIQYQVD